MKIIVLADDSETKEECDLAAITAKFFLDFHTTSQKDYWVFHDGVGERVT